MSIWISFWDARILLLSHLKNPYIWDSCPLMNYVLLVKTYLIGNCGLNLWGKNIWKYVHSNCSISRFLINIKTAVYNLIQKIKILLILKEFWHLYKITSIYDDSHIVKHETILYQFALRKLPERESFLIWKGI